MEAKPQKQIKKQLTGKRDDSALHSAAREGNLEVVVEIINGCGGGGEELIELLSKQNQSGETALYAAAECGHVELVEEMIKHYDVGFAALKAKNGFDAFHIAAKMGKLGVLKALMEADPELLATVDQSNTTALHTAAAQGHVEVVSFLLERNSSLATIARNNGKTALHSSARYGHLEVVKAILRKEPGIATWQDKKGQTALHMAVKGTSTHVVDDLIAADSALLTMQDAKANTALHIATRKARPQILEALLKHKELNKEAINKSGETALDTAEKTGHSAVVALLQQSGVKSAKSLSPPSAARQLKQTVSDIKHEVHDQLQHTRQTRRRVRGIAKRLGKMQSEGLNNAITSTTVVAVLIATVAFAAIFTLPGQYADDRKNVPKGLSLGEANIAPNVEFTIFLIFDSLALFISLAVVVVQTSVVVVERRAKKQMMAVINKLMWLACTFVSVAFLALCYIIVGEEERWLAVGVTVIGSLIMATTLGTLCYWVVMHRIEASNLRRSARNSRSQSWSVSVMSDSDAAEEACNKLYAL
ncbi:ankyrin repeat-containing protein At5g02620-like [Salvia miltiorrhiza]|uniref:ankyrin repeat-containing protein At5g02620-like n=1 Tax=Salvia miltiorrhiza TaxID=226208 RepID=UPI0025AD7FE8|nr:ankyrin repeat-containing protein At5g02620-like [Salvia miltiorrhiza]XP_057801409.1 ankyrin repeat-containing protein At5g02620-like [Salvia miltiorrhiza]XP_057801410.1 ankyrin repeat-containing protein At5g02620-like [Salvia miltiorrhiza]